MKYPKHLDKVIVAALLLAYVPGLAEKVLPAPDPIALIAPAPHIAEDAAEDENPASGL